MPVTCLETRSGVLAVGRASSGSARLGLGLVCGLALGDVVLVVGGGVARERRGEGDEVVPEQVDEQAEAEADAADVRHHRAPADGAEEKVRQRLGA